MTQIYQNFFSKTVETIVCKELCVERSGRRIFDNISFSIKAGEMLLIKGENGIGKSTLLRVLAGLLHHQNGKIEYIGISDQEDYPRHLHYLGHKDPIKSALTVREQLDFWRAFLPSIFESNKERLSTFDVLKILDLNHAIDVPGAYLSQGQRRRISIARLLLSPRPLWILDEPTVGLDTQSEQIFMTLMQDHLNKGGMIIASTHIEMKNLPATPMHLTQDGLIKIEEATVE